MSCGITPAALIGHSVGEFVAAALAGVMSLADALRGWSRERGRADAGAAGRRDAVGAPRRRAARPHACRPAVAGGRERAECLRGRRRRPPPSRRSEAALEADGVACRPLHTSHAFHSAMMDPVLAPFRARGRARRAGGAARSRSCRRVTGALADAPRRPASADYWARHLRGRCASRPRCATRARRTRAACCSKSARARR